MTVFAVAALAGAATAVAEPAWAPAASAKIRPGNQTITDGGQCTSTFVFYDAANGVYIGHAAHCAGTGGATETNGCDSGSLPLGTPVEIEDASRPGTLVYSSWLAMQANGETDLDTCDYNDFALVKVDPADAPTVNPTIPFWGGPTGTATSTQAGDKVLTYGNSSLRGGVRALSPKEGASLGQDGGGWNHQASRATRAAPS